MNKQDILNQIEWHLEETEGENASGTFDQGYKEGCYHCEALIEQLDEPQKVRAKLAKHWHEDVGDCLWWNFPVEEPPYCGTPLDEDFPKYKTHFTELCIPDEVEKEPKWKIINDQKYCLTSIEAGYGNSLHWAFDSTKKKPILFDNEKTALYTAYITGGKAKKV